VNLESKPGFAEISRSFGKEQAPFIPPTERNPSTEQNAEQNAEWL
jgi:hypothetical protein